MKKILFCIHKKSPFYTVIPKALIKLGFKVYIFDYYQPDLDIRLTGLLNNIIKFDPQRIFINRKINNSLVNRVIKIQPNYLFVIKGLDIDNKTINKIKRLKVSTINWFQDLLEFMPWLQKHARVYDFLFTPDPLMQRELKKHNIKSYFLPLASAPDYKFSNHNKVYDVVFSGQYTKRREKLFQNLSALGEKFIIWGYPKWNKSNLSKHYQGYIPSIEQMLERFRQSKIVINVQTAEDKYPSEVVSLRAFETTGVGSFLLNWEHKQIAKFWKDKKEIVNFSDPEDLYNKAIYYLINNKKRQLIAKKGWQRTKRDHTWESRLRTMFSIVT